MEIYLMSIDTSKNVFQVCGVTKCGKKVLEKRLCRAKLEKFIGNYSSIIIAMEVGGGSHHWGRLFKEQGHEVRLISAKHVKPFVKSQKNDRADAEAIAEAALRPQMRFVPVKSIEQQDIQNLHRIRERLVGERTALVNQTRGLLAEYGEVIPKGISSFARLLPQILEDGQDKFTSLTIRTFAALREELVVLDERIKLVEKQLEQIHKNHPECQNLCRIRGVGPMIATAVIATASSPENFKNGRQFSAALGLVPQQNSTGGKSKLLGISKRGNVYLRKLLIQGAKSVLLQIENKHDDLSLWLKRLKARRGHNKAAVALANKNARIIWVLLTKPEQRYRTTYYEFSKLKAAA